MNELPDSGAPDLTPDLDAPVPSQVSGPIRVAGILADGPTDTLVRIYLDSAFATFYDIPRDAVTSRSRVEAVDSPFGVASTVLHVEQGTQITVQHSSSRTIDQEFLAGDFTEPGSFRALTSFQRAGGDGGSRRYPTTVTVFDCRDCIV